MRNYKNKSIYKLLAMFACIAMLIALLPGCSNIQSEQPTEPEFDNRHPESMFNLITLGEDYKFVEWVDASIAFRVNKDDGEQYIIYYTEYADSLVSGMTAIEGEKIEAAGEFKLADDGTLSYMKDGQELSTSAFLLGTASGGVFDFVSWEDASISYRVVDKNDNEFVISYTETNNGEIISGIAGVEQ